MSEKPPERDGSKARSQEHVIRIDASVDDVWRAITDAAEVTRWYVHDAEIEPRVGGAYKVSWGEGMYGESEITVFDPGRCFQVSHVPQDGQPAFPTGPMVEEYRIETDGGQTLLRLVSSGIPDTEEWDWFFEGQERGWVGFLIGLRHYLERHPGKPRDLIVSMIGLPGTFEAGWAELIGPRGLGLEHVEGASAGDSYAGRTVFGQDLGGEILLINPPHRLLATVEPLDDALLTVGFEQMGPNNFLYLALSTFGLLEEDVARLTENWKDMVGTLFPQPANPFETFDAAVDESFAEESS